MKKLTWITLIILGSIILSVLLWFQLWRPTVHQEAASTNLSETKSEARSESKPTTATDSLRSPQQTTHQESIPEKQTPETAPNHHDDESQSTVYNEQGDPIAGALVRVLDPKSKRELSSTLTDEAGRFAVNLQRKFRAIHFEKEGYIGLKVWIQKDLDEIYVLRTSRTYEGQVVDEDNQPVADTNIRLTLSGVALEAQTDESGWFRLLHAGYEGELSLTKAGYVPQEHKLDLISTQPTDLGKFVLQAGFSFRFKVTDSQGIPIEGVKAQGRYSSKTQSDDDGLLTIYEEEKLVALSLYLEHDDFLNKRVVLPLSNDPLQVVQLLRPSSISGRVLNSAGEPVSPVRISCLDGKQHHQLLTDVRDGRYTLTGLNPGMVSVGVRGFGYAPLSRKGIQLGAETHREGVDLILQPGSILRGRILNQKGEPVGDGFLKVTGLANQPPVSLEHSDHLGNYLIPDLATRTIEVLLNHKNYKSSKTTINLAAGENIHDLTLGRPKKLQDLHGTVVDPQGRPLVGMTVIADKDETITDIDGRFMFEDRLSERTLIMAHGNGWEVPRLSLEPNEFEEALTLVAKPQIREVRGRLRDLDPNLIDGLIFTWNHGDRREDFYHPNGRLELDASARTYRITGLSWGPLKLLAETADGRYSARYNLTLTEAVTQRDLNFLPTASFRGRIQLNDQPMPLVHVGMDFYGDITQTYTDERGHFEFPYLPSGHYRVHLSWQGASLDLHTIELPEQSYWETNYYAEPFKGRVRDPMDRPIAEALVTLKDDLGTQQIYTDENGEFILQQVFHGKVNLSIEKLGFREFKNRFDFDETTDQPYDFQLYSPRQLTLRVIPSSEGDEVSVVLSGLLFKQENLEFKSTVAVDGTATIDNVPEGSWDILVQNDDDQVCFLPQITVPGNVVEAVLQKPITLRIKVPQFKQVITIALHEAQGFDLQLDASVFTVMEQFEIENTFWPGTWTLSCEYEDGEVRSQTITLGPGETGELIIPGP